MKTQTFKIEIQHCARCTKDHEVKFEKLETPIDDFTYWGLCPNTLQPVLLKIEEEEGK